MVSRDALASLAVFAVLFALYSVARQEGYWSDGHNLLLALEGGRWKLHHFGYLPLAHALHTLLRRLGSDAENTLHILSASSAALGGALLYLAARRTGCSLHATLVGTALAALAPVTWFYGTCIEVHAAQYAAACGAVYWAVSSPADERRSALVAALFLVALFATHMTGLLWAPALALFVTRRERAWCRPRHLIPALIVLAAAAATWQYANRDLIAGPDHIDRGLEAVLSKWRPYVILFNLVFPAGLLYLALPCFFRGLREPRRMLLEPRGLATLVLFAIALPFAAALLIPERGAYYITFLPPIALAACLAIERGGRALRLAALLALPVQLFFALDQVHEWDREYEGVEWASALVAESEGEGVVLTKERWEWKAIHYHSRMLAISPSMPVREESTAPERGFELTFTAIRRRLERGGVLAITRSLWDADDSLGRELRKRLAREFGEPRPGASPEYLVFGP